MRYPSCADLPRSLARALVILSSLSSKSFRTARNCCILHSFVLVIPLLIVRLSSSTICGTRTTVSSSCWVAIPLAPQLETPKSAQIQATKAHPLDLENSPKFSTNITNAADQQTKFETTFKFYSNYFQILLLKLFSDSIQISFKFYSNYFQILLLKTLFKFYSDFIQILLNYFQILLLKIFADSTQISFRFYSKIRKLCDQELYLTSDIKFRLNFPAPPNTHSLTHSECGVLIQLLLLYGLGG